MKKWILYEEMEKEKIQKNDIIKWIIIFTLFTSIAYGLEALTYFILGREFVWSIKLMDFFDFGIMLPFSVISYFMFHEILIVKNPKLGDDDRKLKIRLLFTFFLFVFAVGWGMHSSTNSINIYSVIIKNYKNVIPEDMYSLIFFYDELFSHLFLFSGFFGMMLILSHSENRNPIKTLKMHESKFILLLGFIYGFGLAIGMIEAQFTYGLFLYTSFSLIYLLSISKNRNLTSLTKHFSERPFNLYFLSILLTILIVSLSYYLAFGSFIQPSEFDVEKLVRGFIFS